MPSIEIISANSEIIILAFDGFNINWIKLNKPYHLMTLTEGGTFYFLGIPKVSKNLPETIVYIRRYINDNNIRLIFVSGVCKGSFASLLIGSLLKATAVFAITPVLSIDEESNKEINDERFIGVSQDGLRKLGYKANPNFAMYMNFVDFFCEDTRYYFHTSLCENCINQLKLLYYLKDNKQINIIKHNKLHHSGEKYDAHVQISNKINEIIDKYYKNS